MSVVWSALYTNFNTPCSMYNVWKVVEFPYKLTYMTAIGCPGCTNDARIWMAYLTEMLKPVVAVMKPRAIARKKLMAVKRRILHQGSSAVLVVYCT